MAMRKPNKTGPTDEQILASLLDRMHSVVDDDGDLDDPDVAIDMAEHFRDLDRPTAVRMAKLILADQTTTKLEKKAAKIAMYELSDDDGDDDE
jgi:hypothetical protein